jgi:3-methyladenine DNA glycosylase AlkC
MEPLKERFNVALITKLASKIKEEYTAFPVSAFTEEVLNKDWQTMELKQRMRHISQALHAHLPPSYSQRIEILRKAAPDFSDFTAMLFPDYVECYGLNTPAISLPALAHFTQFSSSEFAIRPFILQDQKAVMLQMMEWSKHENHHVRRLSSEGCRPRLPWAMALPAFKSDPTPILPILEQLKEDPSEYVRRSVANNLNDISKDHPDLVLRIGRSWYGKNPTTDKLVKHACRTLLKAGNEKALQLFGFKGDAKVKLLIFRLSKQKIKLGAHLDFEFELQLQSKAAQRIRLEYMVYFMKANGSLSKKIFKISELQMQPNEKKSVNKRHAFKDLTTRKHYLGLHQLAIVINGKEMENVSFTLTGK